MKIGIIGSGTVGQLMGGKLVSLGHDVALGTRDPSDLQSMKGMAPPLADWLEGLGRGARVASFSEVAAHGEMVINATAGTVSLEALSLAGKEHLVGKVLIDVSNALDFSHMPPMCLATDQEGGSIGVLIQRAFPKVRVVKTFNTARGPFIIDPLQLANGDHTIFLCGNDSSAKETVSELLRSFGWRDIFDLGEITAAHGMEMMMSIWLRCWQQLGEDRPFNWKLVR